MVGVGGHALETPLERPRSRRQPWMEGATGEGALQAEAPPRDECGRTFHLISRGHVSFFLLPFQEKVVTAPEQWSSLQVEHGRAGVHATATGMEGLTHPTKLGRRISSASTRNRQGIDQNLVPAAARHGCGLGRRPHGARNARSGGAGAGGVAHPVEYLSEQHHQPGLGGDGHLKLLFAPHWRAPLPSLVVWP